MFRLKPTAIISDTSSALAYLGVLEELTGEVWDVAAVTKPTVYMTWAKAGFEIMPTSMTNVVAQLQGSADITSEPPMIVQVCVDEVDSLQIGTAALIAAINNQGTRISPASITMADEVTTLDLSTITGDITLYLSGIRYVTADITAPNMTVTIDTTVTVIGNWNADSSIVKDWETIEYNGSQTVVTFPTGYSATVRLLIDEGNLLVERYAATATMAEVPGRYPAYGIDRDNHLITDVTPIIKRGSTFYRLAQFDDQRLAIIVPNWIYGPIAKTGMNNAILPTNPATAVQPDGTVRWSDIFGRPNTAVADIETVVISGLTKLPNVPVDTNAALGLKVDKVAGKGLSTNDYTNGEKTKVSYLPANISETLTLKADLVEGKIPASQLPDIVLGALYYKGQYDADANNEYPLEPSQGDYYVVSVAGTIAGTEYDIGDWMVYNGTTWDNISKDPSGEILAHEEMYDHAKLFTGNVICCYQGDSFADKLDAAVALTKTVDNRATLMVEPGSYALVEDYYLTEDYVDIVSMTNVKGSVKLTGADLKFSTVEPAATCQDNVFIGLDFSGTTSSTILPPDNQPYVNFIKCIIGDRNQLEIPPETGIDFAGLIEDCDIGLDFLYNGNNVGTIRNCTISDNLCMFGNNTGIISGCTINAALLGGGNNHGVIKDCTIAGSFLSDSSGATTNTGLIHNCTIGDYFLSGDTVSPVNSGVISNCTIGDYFFSMLEGTGQNSGTIKFCEIDATIAFLDSSLVAGGTYYFCKANDGAITELTYDA